MSLTIAVAGKGGSGKTTITSLVIRYLLKDSLMPVLAVDADPNANLGEGLGLEIRDTVGQMLDRFQAEKNDIPSGMTKESYLEYKLNSLLLESRNFDLLTMGKGEGQGCYCYPNSILRKYIDRLSVNYAFIVMDNEAGMEHLSRGTTQDIDELLIVSNHSIKGVRTLARIRELVADLKLRIKHQSVIINMVPGRPDPLVMEELEKLHLQPAAIIPQDGQINEFDLAVRSLLEMPEDSLAVTALDRFLSDTIGSGIKQTIKKI